MFVNLVDFVFILFVKVSFAPLCSWWWIRKGWKDHFCSLRDISDPVYTLNTSVAEQELATEISHQFTNALLKQYIRSFCVYWLSVNLKQRKILNIVKSEANYLLEIGELNNSLPCHVIQGHFVLWNIPGYSFIRQLVYLQIGEWELQI